MNRRCLPALVLLLLVAVQAAAAEGIPGDADGDRVLTRAEYVAAALAYMIGDNDLGRADIQDAAQVYAFWDGRPARSPTRPGRR